MPSSPNNPLISVIVPVYNVEDYLVKCLESIIMQKSDNFEIICVNDGSTDSSESILREFSLKYPNITVISQANKGLAAARNKGMQSAKGKYICFIDSDDYIMPGMFDIVAKHNADLIICGTLLQSVDETVDNSIYKNRQQYFNLPETGLYYNSSASYNNLNSTAWNKFFKRKIIETHNLSFPEGKLYEDSPFYRQYIIHCTTVYIDRKSYYIYQQREDSIMYKPKARNNPHALDAMESALALFNGVGKLPSRFTPEYFDYLQIDTMCSYDKFHDEDKAAGLAQIKAILTPFIPQIKVSAARSTAKKFFDDIISGNWPYDPNSLYLGYPASKSQLFPLFRLPNSPILSYLIVHIPHYERLVQWYITRSSSFMKKIIKAIPIAKLRRKLRKRLENRHVGLESKYQWH